MLESRGVRKITQLSTQIVFKGSVFSIHLLHDQQLLL